MDTYAALHETHTQNWRQDTQFVKSDTHHKKIQFKNKNADNTF